VASRSSVRLAVASVLRSESLALYRPVRRGRNSAGPPRDTDRRVAQEDLEEDGHSECHDDGDADGEPDVVCVGGHSPTHSSRRAIGTNPRGTGHARATRRWHAWRCVRRGQWRHEESLAAAFGVGPLDVVGAGPAAGAGPMRRRCWHGRGPASKSQQRHTHRCVNVSSPCRPQNSHTGQGPSKFMTAPTVLQRLPQATSTPLHTGSRPQ
jgi:hypothetical protein